MVDGLAFPVRIVNNRFVRVEQGSDAQAAQRYAQMILTRYGERPMMPAFGVPDPTFTGRFDTGALVAAAQTFGPDRRIVRVDVEAVDDVTLKVVVDFD